MREAERIKWASDFAQRAVSEKRLNPINVPAPNRVVSQIRQAQQNRKTGRR